MTQILCLQSSWGLSHIPQGDGTITGQLVAALQQEGSYLDVRGWKPADLGSFKHEHLFLPRVGFEVRPDLETRFRGDT